MRKGKYGFWGGMLLLIGVICIAFSTSFPYLFILTGIIFVVAIILIVFSFKKGEY